MGVRGSYSKANVKEWRFQSWLHHKSLGNFRFIPFVGLSFPTYKMGECPYLQ